MKLPSFREIARGLVGLFLAAFLIYSDKILSWYQALPLVVNWSASAIVCGILLILGDYIRRHPRKIKPHTKPLQEAVGDVRFALFTFIFVGVGDSFYKLDVFLYSFYLYWGTWVVFGLQALLMVTISGLQYERLNWGYRLAKFVFKIGRRLAKR